MSKGQKRTSSPGKSRIRQWVITHHSKGYQPEEMLELNSSLSLETIYEVLAWATSEGLLGVTTETNS